MTLEAAEVRRVQRETKHRRNAAARARRWCTRMGATVDRDVVDGAPLFTVRVAGFHPAYARVLEHAVDALRRNVEHFCESPATHGPTGAKLDRLRALQGAPGGN